MQARKEREVIAVVSGERDLLTGERTNIFAQLDKINKEVCGMQFYRAADDCELLVSRCCEEP